MNRAFLCHSSKDKEYVRIVAKQLGRGKVVFDEMSFSPGEDFRNEITRKLDGTRLFVFFVSRNSINSDWCRFELDEAQKRILSGTIDQHLVIITDRDISYSDLPDWLQTSKAVIQTRPSQATRDIVNALYSLAPTEDRLPFVGRQRLLEQFGDNVSRLGAPTPHVIIASGLDGIGKRSYLTRACKEFLDLRLGPVFVAGETIGPLDLFLWVLNETGDVETRKGLSAEMARFEALALNEQIAEISERLSLVCQDNFVPCIVDQGGLLDDDGRYVPFFEELIDSLITEDSDNYLAITHRRSPRVQDLKQVSLLTHQRIPPLEDGESRILFQLLLKRRGVRTTSEQLENLQEYIAGYPPAAYFAAAYASDFGVSVLEADTSLLADFKARRFTKFITDLKITETEWKVLHYMALEQLLSLSGIAIAMELDLATTASVLRTLIDESLVLSVNELYGVSSPVRDAIIRVRGYHDAGYYSDVRHRLTDAFWRDENAAPSVEIIDATLHAVARSGLSSFDPYQDLVRVSLIHRLAKESYYRKEWLQAIAYAGRALNIDATRLDARIIQFKALCQLDRWQEAEAQLSLIQQSGHRMSLYLRGFMLKKRRDYASASAAFKAAIDSGDRSDSVYRDYADVLHRCGRYAEALEMANLVLRKRSENIFILDLLVRIYTDSGNYDQAERYLADLRRFDFERRFVHQRQARLYSAQSRWESAIVEADRAVELDNAPLEIFGQRVDILIELGQFQKAHLALDEIETRFRSHRLDVQRGLRCKLLAREGKWQEARLVWERLSDKTLAVHRGLLAAILDVKASDGGVPLVDRESAKKEADAIRLELGALDNDQWGSEEDEEVPGESVASGMR